MTRTPATLLEKLRTSPDDEAWARLVELYTPLLLSWVRRLGIRQSETEDLVQDVFAHLVLKLPGFSYDRTRSFRAWLRTVAHNLWRNQRQSRLPQPAPVELDELASPEIEGFWEVEYRRHLVDRALLIMRDEFLPSTCRACWEMVVNGRSAEDVGAELGLSAQAVRAAKYRVLNRLRGELDGLLD